MKKFLLFVCALAVCFAAGAAKATVDYKLWEGTTVCADDWSSGWLKLSAADLAEAAVGDEILVNVSEVSSSCDWPQLALQNGSWGNFTPSIFIALKDVTVPYLSATTITESMLAEIQSTGMVVKGSGFTFTSVVLRHYFETGDSDEKGDAVTNIWSGSEIISWSGDYRYSQKIEAGKFTTATAGMQIRISFTSTAVSSVGSLVYGDYSNISDFKNVTPLSGSYYSYTITDESLAELQSKGLRVSGVGYTATSVDLVDPAKEYSVVAQFENSDIRVWNAGETPKLSMNITNYESIELTVPYKVQLFSDMVDTATGTHTLLKEYTTDVTLGAGETKSATIEFADITTPGFYRMNAIVNGKDICSYYIGYNPTALNNVRDAQADFWTYWDDAKSQLAAIDGEYTLELLSDFSTANRNVYLVTMKSVPDEPDGEPIIIKGYYAEPVDAGKYPVIIRFQGTDGGTSALPNPMNGDDLPGWCEFVLSTRGQMLCRDSKYGFDFYSYGWGDKDRHYYRNAYLDCVRGVDFILSREKVNRDEVFGAGGSQGGCFTYVAAGLTGAFRAIAPSITGHADFVSGMRIVNWPRAKFLAAQESLGWTDEQRDIFNSYYDTMNFSERITCAVITNFSLQDVTDPARTNIAPYNLLVNVPADQKEWSINPFLGHATPSDWNQRYMGFFSKYVKITDPTDTQVVTTVWKGEKVIDWSGTIANGWQTVPATAFANAKAGMKLRLNFTDLAIGAQGHISNGSWGDMPDGTAFVPLTASYWEYDITDNMLASLKSGGCIVTGIGFSLTSIDLINTSLISEISCSVTDESVTCWEADENPTIDIVIKNDGNDEATTAVKLILRTDSYASVSTETKDVTLAAGATETVSFPLSLTPGFYHAIVEANYSLLKDFNIGFNPTAIEVTPDAQSDFADFWAKAKNDLAAVAPEYTLTEIPEKSTEKRKVYLVEMKSVDNGDGVPVTIRGYYLEPVAAGTYPVIITQNGYDSGYEPWCPGGDDNPEWIELYMSNRGQLINNREPYKEENAFYGDWFQYNFGDKDKYYYRGAYMDVVRSIDFIASREKVQQNNIFMTGASQGGAFTIAGAALDSRLNAIAPAIQFMGDFPNYFKVGEWPRYQALQQQTALGLSDDELYAFLSYFDTKNLATLVTCPVTTCMGLQDPVCPIRTNFAPYNVFTSTDKHYVVNDNCKHETPAEWYNTYITFFNEHLKSASVVDAIAKEAEADAPRYNVLGIRVGDDYKGIVISNGKKFVQK